MKSKSMVALASTLAVVTFTQAAWAHPGHGATSGIAGFAHPFSGVDHLLAMIAVGLAWFIVRREDVTIYRSQRR